MLRITHTRGRRAPAVETFAIPRVRIGSAPGSELAFAHGADPGVMPHHAEIRSDGRGYHVVDLGTPSGTYVNRERVAERRLRHGDVVSLGGGAEFRVEVVGPPPDPPPGVPDAEGRVDLETAKRMVEAAVLRANAGSGHDKAGEIVRVKLTAARRTAARNNAFLTLGVVLALGCTMIAAVLVWRSQRAARALATEVGIDNSPGPKVEGSIPTRVMSGREIYEANKAALYVIGYLLGNKVGGVCTAFAIKSDVLATNAHCIKAYQDKGGSPIVTQNDSGGRVRFKILAAQMHPEYRAGSGSADSPDVGLLRIDGRMPRTVTLASDAELRAIGPGDDAFVLGFPGRVMDPLSPSVTFLQGHVGRVMGMREEQTSPDKAVLVQHDAVTRGGNSGSPVFNQYGHVIAVHAAHLDDEQDQKVGGQQTKVVQSSPFRIGMRVDLLRGIRAP